jgi:hypothetical protein
VLDVRIVRMLRPSLAVLFTLVLAMPATAEPPDLPPKILHAEPLFIDLIRDLGARKGEKEWKFGFGLTDQARFDRYEALVEYEWAPINRLGLEVEVPFTFFPPVNNGAVTPSSRIEGLKTAMQWTFLVSEKHQTSLALGYLNEAKFADLDSIRETRFVQGNIYNPFFVAARRLGSQWHSLVYTGPQIYQPFRKSGLEWAYELNSNLHYMVGETRNFVGMEVNKTFAPGDFDMTLRPQMRLEISEQLLIGIVTGIPIKRENQRLSMFLRLIYEPKTH